MEIIDELEVDKRGVYGGCIGYFGASGEMDTCIVLRTVDHQGRPHACAGRAPGIVYDSDPAYEQRECVNKAKALFRAAEEAVRFATRGKKGAVREKAMHADIARRRAALAALCRRYDVARLEVFGSAARGTGFDPKQSDVDFLVTFTPAARNDLAAFADFKEALEALLGAPSISSSARRSKQAAISFAGGQFCERPRRSMAELSDRDAALLLDMLLAARDARGFVEGIDEAAFLGSRLHQNATIRSLEVIGEAAGKVSTAAQAAHPEIPWREITGMRHRLIHGYGECVSISSGRSCATASAR